MRLALKVSELAWKGARFVAISRSLQLPNPTLDILPTSTAMLYTHRCHWALVGINGACCWDPERYGCCGREQCCWRNYAQALHTLRRGSLLHGHNVVPDWQAVWRAVTLAAVDLNTLGILTGPPTRSVPVRV